MRLHSGTALRSPLSLPVMPNTINSIILLCQMYSATLSGHSLSQRPHPDVQARVRTVEAEPSIFYFSSYLQSTMSHFVEAGCKPLNKQMVDI